MEHKPTVAQQKIYEFVKNGFGNGIIDAVAGAGKTTTLMECADYIPNITDSLYCAFNTSIRKEIQKKFKKANKPIVVNTIHALGYALLRAQRDYKIDDNKYKQTINNKDFFDTLIPEFDRILGYHNHPTVSEIRRLDEIREALDWDEKNQLNEGQQYVRKIINRLLDINDKYRCTLSDDKLESYDKMVQHFGIFEACEISYNYYKDELSCYFRAHQKLLKEGISMAISHGIVDYTDMLYLPYVLNLTSKEKYGFVFVDECQDLSKAQLNVVKQYVRESGRVLAVGDPYQSIYGFAGADSESFQRVKEAFNCTQLELSDCFRCPQEVIKIAKKIRHDINGFKNYPGKIYRIQTKDVIKNIKQGDLVICRSRAPLLELALNLIKKDFKVKIHPDELEEFMTDCKRYFSPSEKRMILTDSMIDAFFDGIREKNEKRIKRENQNADSVIRNILINEAISEMKETLSFLKQKYFDWHENTLDSIFAKLKKKLAYTGEDAIKISTIHRSKGLENDRVFILEYNKLPYRREREWEQIQERNLHYVAVTRPKEELYLVEDKLYIDGDLDSEDDDDVSTPEQYTPTTIDDKIGVNIQEFNSGISVEHDIDESDQYPQVVNDSQNQDNNSFENDLKTDFKSENQGFVEMTNDKIDTTELLDSFHSASSQKISGVIRILPIQLISNIPDKFYSLAESENTPYESLNSRNIQKQKYWSIFKNLQKEGFSIVDVKCAQYQDIYFIKTPTGIETYQGWYKNSGQYTFKLQGPCPNAEIILPLLNDESDYKIEINYHPDHFDFETIHSTIKNACQSLGICNTNIYTEQYNLVYCFKTVGSYAYIKFTYNGKNIISTIMPSSTLGDNDNILKILIEIIKNLWQM